MDLAREMQMQELRERIERDAYEVDPHAIADAIVARLLTATRATQSEQAPKRS
jgi:anti-sigma28 factor (negative regulator of flagellin synthesis)